MQKLTAEKCREMFLHLFEDKRQDGITLKEDLYMQALEIALPILEQQEMITDSQPVITDNAEMITDSVERESFEDWFKGAMHLGGRCFVDKPTKRRMWRAWQAATYRQPERATNQNGEQ